MNAPTTFLTSAILMSVSVTVTFVPGTAGKTRMRAVSVIDGLLAQAVYLQRLLQEHG